jgi:hypothetical protein
VGESVGPHCSTSRLIGCGYFADSRGYSKSAAGLTVHVYTHVPADSSHPPLPHCPFNGTHLSPTYSAILQYARVVAVPSPSPHSIHPSKRREGALPHHSPSHDPWAEAPPRILQTRPMAAGGSHSHPPPPAPSPAQGGSPPPFSTTLLHPSNLSLGLQFPPTLQGLRVRVDNSYPTANPLREAQVL